MATLYEKGEHVRVRTITSEMDAIIVDDPKYVDGRGYVQGGWFAKTVPAAHPYNRPIERRILGRSERR